MARFAASAIAAVLSVRPFVAGAAGADASCASRPPAQENVLLQVRSPEPWQQTSHPTPQPPSQNKTCKFAVAPQTPHYWDETCYVGKVGCWADGVNVQCRFCNYAGIQCPEDAERPTKLTCRFDNVPESGYYWEKGCPLIDNGLGCLADGKHQGCRFCGGNGAYRSIECKVEECTFANEPMIPYYFDPSCALGKLGCNADGIHVGCRYCGARPYQNITCPPSAAVPEKACWFPNQPSAPYFWDETCRMGVLGCWADGIHAQCRFCRRHAGEGEGDEYATIHCPNEAPHAEGSVNASHANASHANASQANEGRANDGQANEGHENASHANASHANASHANEGHANDVHANEGHENESDANEGHENESDANETDGSNSS